jgi:transcriptional regulator of acetoin/glycerol metabolism
MCVDETVWVSRWTDADDVVLATTHHLPVLISAATDQAVAGAARELHVASFSRPASLVTFRASGFFEQPIPFAAQWRALCDAARDGSVLLTAVEEMSHPAQLLLLDVLTSPRPPRAPRLIAGTTVALYERLATGEFSEELFYKLNGLHLEVLDGEATR